MSNFLFYVCGSSGQIRTFDGADWSSITSGTAQTLRGLYGFKRDSVIFGGENGVVVHYDGGGTPSVLSTPDTRDIIAMSGCSENEVYCVANNINNNDSQLWLYSGSSFVLLDTLNRRSYAMYCPSSGSVYICGGGGIGSYSGVGLYDGSFSDDTSVELKDGAYFPDMTGVYGDKNGTIYVATTGPGSSKYVWSGYFNSWSLSDVGVSSHVHGPYFGNSIWCDENGTVFHITSTGTGGYVLIRQKNAEGSWFEAYRTSWALSGSSIGGIFGVQDGRILAVATANVSGAKPYYIYFDGTSWSDGLIPGSVFNPIGVWAYDPPSSTYQKPTSRSRKYSILLNCDGTLDLDSNNELAVDDTIVSRVIFRLKCRLGEWWADKTIGSRLHTIKIMKEAERKVEAFSIEALQPLIDEGSLLSVEVPEIKKNEPRGALFARLLIGVPGEDQLVDLGFIEIGK